jgi:hypothetical protein
MTTKRKELLFTLGFYKSTINFNEANYEKAIYSKIKVPDIEVVSLSPDSFKALLTTKLEIAKMLILKDIEKAQNAITNYEETTTDI